MDTKSVYDVHLYVGQDIMGDSADIDKRVETLVSRQMLCDMTSKIEYNIWQLNQGRDHSIYVPNDEDAFYDGLKYRNLNYIITGVRGSGKTTFLNYLIQSLTRQVDPFDESLPKKRNRYSAQFYIGEPRKNVNCKLLSRFDPSCPCYTRGGFLIAVVAAIQSKLEEVSKSVYHMGDSSDLLLMECNQELKKLDKVISRATHQKEAWLELSEYQVAHLRSEADGLEKIIRDGFHKVLEILCRICHVDAFIVSIDDADTNFGQCAVVLEDLRMYMTSSRLVILMAGDRDLYLERIRELHFSEYNLEYHQVDTKGAKYRMDFVMNHASQYLIKLFPLENQYELRDLNYLSEKLDPIRCVVHAKGDAHSGGKKLSSDLFDLIENVFSVAINTHELCIDNFARLFLKMPLRSIVQVLNSWTLDKVWSKLVKMGYIDILGKAQKPKRELRGEDELELRGIRNLIKDAVFTVLKNEIRFDDYSFRNINLESPRDFYLLMQAMCRNMNDVEHGYFLTGSACSNYSDQYVALLLALSAHNYLKGLEGFLSYFLYGPANVSLYAKALKQVHQKYKGNVDENAIRKFNDDFSQYLHVSSWESPSRWARHANMIWCFDEGREGMHLGILRLRHTVLVQKLNRAVFTFSREMLSSRKDCAEKMKKALALRVCMSRSEARDNSYFISLFGFLAFILKCESCCKRVIQRKSWLKDPDGRIPACAKALEPMFRESVVIKSCRNPEWLISHEDEVNHNTADVCYQLAEEKEGDETPIYNSGVKGASGENVLIEQQFEMTYEAVIKDVVERIATWHVKRDLESSSKQPPQNDMSPLQMGRVWTRFYYNLKHDMYSVKKVSMYSEASPSDMESLGMLLHKVAESFSRAFSQKENTLSGYFKNLIFSFPLSVDFVNACKEYAKELNTDKLAGSKTPEVEKSSVSSGDAFCPCRRAASYYITYSPNPATDPHTEE